MKKDTHPNLKPTLVLTGTAVIAILLTFLLLHLEEVGTALSETIAILMPFLIGAVIAYILTPICNFFEKHLTRLLQNRKRGVKTAEKLSVMLSLLLGFAVVATLLVIVVPTLLETITSILVQIPVWAENVKNWAIRLVGSNETLQNYINDLTETVSVSLPGWVSETLLPKLQTLIGGVYTGVVRILKLCYNLIIGIIVSVYLLGSRKTFIRQGKKLVYSIFPGKWANIVINEIKYAHRMFTGFISGRIVDSCIIGVICFVGMLILRIPYPMLISVIVGVTNIIPFFGPYIGAIPSFLLLLMANPIKAVVFLIFVLILQQFDGNILGPKILGNVTGLSSFWVLFSIIFFGGKFGFVGMIVGVPVFAVIYDVIRKLVNKGLARRKAKEKKDMPEKGENSLVYIAQSKEHHEYETE